MYKPNPIDTSDIVLPDNLLELTEKIAENVHEVWAQGRINEGWTFGPIRDNEKKKRPALSVITSLLKAKRNTTETPLWKL